MIYDKIKIYVTDSILSTLKKDAENFEFYKSDMVKINHNKFLSQLIVNYTDDYQAKQDRLIDYLHNTISKNTTASTRQINDLCLEINAHLNDWLSAPANEKYDKIVSLKPTRETDSIISYIEQYQLSGCSLSEYFRNMFASYCALPQDKREAIIFKKQREALLDAINKKKKVFITGCTTNKDGIIVSPYAIISSKEELHSYLLYSNNDICMPRRISRIKTVTILKDDCYFTDKELALFDKMKQYSPQYFYGYDEEEVTIELTKVGIEKFRKMYIHRPVPKSIDGNIYTFECSHSQIMQYFRRFGKEAYIISPKSLRDGMLYYYRKAHYFYAKRIKECESDKDKYDKQS